jgi:hypothetical protein
LSKLKLLLFPFQNKVWQRVSVDETYAQQVSVSPQLAQMIHSHPVCLTRLSHTQDELSNSHKWLAPRHDVNAPDLYLPVMAFVTYVLLVGYVKGTNNNFTPEVLIQAVWICLLIQMVEAGVMKVGLSMLQTTLPFLDLFSYTGYKYVGLCLVTLSLPFGSTFYFLVSLYTAVTIAFFVLKTMAAAVPSANQLPAGGPPRHLVLLAFAGMQFIVHALLCYL